MRRRLRQQRAHRQDGMTLLELMISLTVLTVGLLSLISLIVIAVSGNNRNKVDTSGTLISQTFMESILSQAAAGTVTISDCADTSFTVNTAGPATAGTSNGANLKSDGSGIDFTQSLSGVTAGYKALYKGCGAGGTVTTYDVRWNVRTIDALSRMVTVSARPNGAISNPRLFTPPVSLRSIMTK